MLKPSRIRGVSSLSPSSATSSRCRSSCSIGMAAWSRGDDPAASANGSIGCGNRALARRFRRCGRFAPGATMAYDPDEGVTMDDAILLICYDGSEGARRAIDVAAGLLVPRRATVVDIAPAMTREESLAALSPVSVVAYFEEASMADALTRANEGAAHARKAGFDSEAHAEIAAPTWQGIVDLADELDAAAIVMGSRGLSGAREIVDGSLSHQVAAHAGRPVLIVPPLR